MIRLTPPKSDRNHSIHLLYPCLQPLADGRPRRGFALAPGFSASTGPFNHRLPNFAPRSVIRTLASVLQYSRAIVTDRTGGRRLINRLAFIPVMGEPSPKGFFFPE
jgi:hypothetical protein